MAEMAVFWLKVPLSGWLESKFKRKATMLGVPQLGPPEVPFYQHFWGRVPLRKETTAKRGTLILTSVLEDLGKQTKRKPNFCCIVLYCPG